MTTLIETTPKMDWVIQDIEHVVEGAPQARPGREVAGTRPAEAWNTPDYQRRQPRTNGSGVCCHTGGGCAGHVARS